MKKMFINSLPVGRLNRGNEINWKGSVGHKVKFIYNDIEGYVTIIECDIKTRKLIIRYNNKQVEIAINLFKECKIGNILGKKTSEFKIEIGTRFQDEKRDITIIDRKIIPRYNKDGSLKGNDKYYKYHCNKCGFNGGRHWSNTYEEYKDECWIIESSLLCGTGCACCCNNPQIVVEGINDVPTTAPWMVKYFQGGYDEAKRFSKCSHQKIYPICTDCGRTKDKKMSINNIYNYHSINCSCSDSTPYPEKFMFNILEQLGINFEFHKTFDWSKNVQLDNLNLCGRKEYDFYLYDYDIVIETHGLQHYEEINNWNQKIEETQLNDKLKKELALENGIKEENYIVVDCGYSTLEHIKNSILNNDKMNKHFDLGNIDWLKAEEFSLSNLVKIACEYKNDNPNLTTLEIGKIMRYHRGTIGTWLKKGNELNWCRYDAKEEQIKGSINNGEYARKPVEIFKQGISLGVFVSASELDRQSEELFGVKLHRSGISQVCLGNLKIYKGYTFKYIKEI